ncbi:MAG: FAD-dependent oxidoreductase [Caldilineaceae bacterium]
MKIGVVGSGPAGLTAAYRLQQAGHKVEVLEALDVIGGRTHAEHFGPGHHCDTGAGWLATFYTQTLALFDELGYRDLFVRPRTVRGAADLLVDGQLYPWPFRAETVANSTLLTDADKQRFGAYLAHLMAVQPADLQPDLHYDGRNAADEFTPLGANIVEYIMRSLFEGPWFTRLDTLSASHVRTWLAAVQEAFFFQMAGGMDAPWLKLAQQLNVRTGESIESLSLSAQQVKLHGRGGERTYDGVVLAVPAPAAVRILERIRPQSPELAPNWLGDVRYAPQVRIYAARQNSADAQLGVHLLPPTDLFSVEYYSGRHGAWGACPEDWQWGLVCTYGPTCAKFLTQDADAVMQNLWAQARAVAPQMFTLEEAEVVHYHRWEWAVPIMHPGHYGNLAAFQQKPPVVFAGDWMNEACVEGAVRSGEAAARVFEK